jgi:hypothetical protein
LPDNEALRCIPPLALEILLSGTALEARLKRSLLTLACILIASTSAAAPPRSTFRYKAPKEEDQRPVIIDATIAPQGSDFAMRLVFNKEPWGEACKNRCANSTLFLDTDSNTTTGLQLGKQPETGADMAVVIQGVREYRGASSVASVVFPFLSQMVHLN